MRFDVSVYKTTYVNYMFEVIKNEEDVDIKQIEKELYNTLYYDEPIEFPYRVGEKIVLYINCNEVILEVTYVDKDGKDDEGLNIEIE